jgi:3-oxoacyl-[acyl-carrier protein] reductase
MLEIASLAGRKALITGGSGGLGSAVALTLARAGATVAICGRDAQRVADLARQLSLESGGKIEPVRLDLLQPGDAAQAVATAVGRIGGLDILVNAAGAPSDGRFESVPPEAWQRSYAIKFFGAVDTIRAALPHMKAAGRGAAIITLSGLFGTEPAPGNIVSGSINAALENFMKALAGDVARYGIRAITVCPGPFYTARIKTILEHRAREEGRPYEEVLRREESALPLGRFGKPEELAEMISVLVSDQANFITGTVITMDGGARRSA